MIDATERNTASPMDQFAASAGAAIWIVVNKIDLVTQNRINEFKFTTINLVHFISSVTGTGVDELISTLLHFTEGIFTAEPTLVTRERQRAHLRETVLSLRAAREAAHDGREEIMAEHLRLAARALGKLLGRVDVEDVLDVIFRDFCIGK
jgi:tRNA modification GTPase